MTRYAAVALALFAVLAAPARGAGGPVTGSDAGPLGVTGHGIALRYVSERVHGGTLVLAMQRRGGAVVNSRVLHERLVVPAVAFDGSATGLSGDGRTLVLSAPRIRFPQKRSHFAVLDTRTLQTRSTVRLRGDYALDAVSPDGRLLYLIESRSRDGTQYAVRAYDVARGRLLRAPVVDPTEPDEPMRGSPLTRAMSRDGRWAYTLYDGGGKAPFIHALDTSRATAKCVDVDALTGRRDLTALRLTVSRGGAIAVRDGVARAVLVVDPKTFAVRRPRHASPPVADGGIGWPAPVGGVAVLVLLGAAALRGGRRRTDGDLGQLHL